MQVGGAALPERNALEIFSKPLRLAVLRTGSSYAFQGYREHPELAKRGVSWTPCNWFIPQRDLVGTKELSLSAHRVACKPSLIASSFGIGSDNRDQARGTLVNTVAGDLRTSTSSFCCFIILAINTYLLVPCLLR